MEKMTIPKNVDKYKIKEKSVLNPIESKINDKSNEEPKWHI